MKNIYLVQVIGNYSIGVDSEIIGAYDSNEKAMSAVASTLAEFTNQIDNNEFVDFKPNNYKVLWHSNGVDVIDNSECHYYERIFISQLELK